MTRSEHKPGRVAYQVSLRGSTLECHVTHEPAGLLPSSPFHSWQAPEAPQAGMPRPGPSALVPGSQTAPLSAAPPFHAAPEGLLPYPNYTSPGIDFSALPFPIGKASHSSSGSEALYVEHSDRAYTEEQWEELTSSPFTPIPLPCSGWCSVRAQAGGDTWTTVCSFSDCAGCSECTHASPTLRSSPPPTAASMPPIYFINMDKDVEKRELLTKGLSELPSWQRRSRVAAVDGDQVISCLDNGSCSIPDEARVLDWNFNNSEGKLYWELHQDHIYSTKELGCVLSHIKAIQQAYAAGEQTVLIVEDDIGLDHVPHWPDSLQDVVSSAPPDWDVLQLWTNNPALYHFFGGASGYGKAAAPVPAAATAAVDATKLKPVTMPKAQVLWDASSLRPAPTPTAKAEHDELRRRVQITPKDESTYAVPEELRKGLADGGASPACSFTTHEYQKPAFVRWYDDDDKHSGLWSTMAYLINRKGMRKILEGVDGLEGKMGSLRLPVLADHLLFRLANATYTYTRPLFRQGGFNSSIQPSSDRMDFHRGGAPANYDPAEQTDGLTNQLVTDYFEAGPCPLRKDHGLRLAVLATTFAEEEPIHRKNMRVLSTALGWGSRTRIVAYAINAIDNQVEVWQEWAAEADRRGIPTMVRDAKRALRAGFESKLVSQLPLLRELTRRVAWDYVMTIDGDISLANADLYQLFHMLQTAQPLIAQPTIRLPAGTNPEDTRYGWGSQWYRRANYNLTATCESRLRDTPYIESQATILSRRLLEFQWEAMQQVASLQRKHQCDWYHDLLWCPAADRLSAMLPERPPACVIIETPVEHMDTQSIGWEDTNDFEQRCGIMGGLMRLDLRDGCGRGPRTNISLQSLRDVMPATCINDWLEIAGDGCRSTSKQPDWRTPVGPLQSYGQFILSDAQCQSLEKKSLRDAQLRELELQEAHSKQLGSEPRKVPTGSLRLDAGGVTTHPGSVLRKPGMGFPPPMCDGMNAMVGESGPLEALSVPFYMYDPQEFSMYVGCELNGFPHNKHAQGLFFIERLQNSRWRTDKIEHASVAVVPILVDWAANGLCGGISNSDHVANATVVIEQHARGLSREIPHLVIAADGASGNVVAQLRAKLPSLRVGTNVGIFESPSTNLDAGDGVSLGPCDFNVGYLTHFDAYSSMAPWNVQRLAQGRSVPAREGPQPSGESCSEAGWDATMSLPDPSNSTRRAYKLEFLEFIGGARSKEGFTDRQTFLRSLDDFDAIGAQWFVAIQGESEAEATKATTGALSTVARLEYADAQALRADSEFSLMLRGDDQTSDRLQNAVASLTIPIVVEGDSMNWLPFPHVVDWNSILVVVPRDAFEENATAALLHAMQELSEDERVARRRAMSAARKEFLWTLASDSRVHERMLQAALLETADCADPSHGSMVVLQKKAAPWPAHTGSITRRPL